MTIAVVDKAKTPRGSDCRQHEPNHRWCLCHMSTPNRGGWPAFSCVTVGSLELIQTFKVDFKRVEECARSEDYGMPRGGARPGAGRKRKTERPAIAAALKMQRAVAQHHLDTQVDLNAAMPLEVMLDNMRWAHSGAQEMLARMRGLEPGHADQQSLKELLKLRAIAQACAADAAPYLHPRLAAVATLNPPQDAPKSAEEILDMFLAKIDGQSRGLPVPRVDR